MGKYSKREMKLMREIPKYVEQIINELMLQNHQAFLIGGCVRDMLLEKEPKDWDITTSATPNEIMSMFSHVVPTGEKHGTVTVIIENNPVEVTTFRKDGKYFDCRRPESDEFTKELIEDVARRDFTINTLALDINSNLYDYYEGQNDLKNKIIRVVGNGDRFKEDALRMLRAIRFSVQLGFIIEPKTEEYIKIYAHLINNISAERIRDELCKIIMSPNPDKGLITLQSLGLLKYIIPELEQTFGFNQHNINHDYDVFTHIVNVVKEVPQRLNVRLGALLHDIGKPISFSIDNGKGHFYDHHIIGEKIALDIMKRLKFDNDITNSISILVKEHMSRYPRLRNISVKKLINRVGIENLEDLFDLQIADIIGAKHFYNQDHIQEVINLKNQVYDILNTKQPLTIKDLDINGYDLMDLGIKPGKEMGVILNNLLEKVLENPELNNKEELKKIIIL